MVPAALWLPGTRAQHSAPAADARVLGATCGGAQGWQPAQCKHARRTPPDMRVCYGSWRPVHVAVAARMCGWCHVPGMPVTTSCSGLWRMASPSAVLGVSMPLRRKCTAVPTLGTHTGRCGQVITRSCTDHALPALALAPQQLYAPALAAPTVKPRRCCRPGGGGSPAAAGRDGQRGGCRPVGDLQKGG